MSALPFLRAEPGGVRLFVRASPKAKRSEIAGTVTMDDGKTYLSVRLHALPAEGEANAELIRFLSKMLKLRQADIEITSGAQARTKALFVAGLTEAQARERLAPFLAEGEE